MENQTVSIIGGGIAGLTTAVALNKIGITTQIFEASNEIAPVGAGLGLGINAMRAFKSLGIDQDVIAKGRIIPSFSINDHHGKMISKTNFDDGSDIGNFTIHRAKLHEVLLSNIDASTLHLGKRIKSFTTTEFGVRLVFEDGNNHMTNYLIVADGIHSVIRQNLLPKSQPRYSGYTCWRAVIKNHLLNINETSETWGPNGRFGIIPLADNNLYWFACINGNQNDEKFKSYQISDLQNHFNGYHQPIPDILHATNDLQLIHNDIVDIQPIDQFAFGRIVLLGDAAHATTPNMGQGACQAIEDAFVIAQCMLKQNQYELAFQHFEKRRLKRTKWIIDTSRSLGRIAQLENSTLIGIRNTLLRYTPESVKARQINQIAKVDFIQS